MIRSVPPAASAASPVAVVAAADDEGLACGLAFVVAAGSADETLALALLEHTAGRLSRYLVPARIEFVDELPRTATGKVQRYRLRDR